MIALIPRIVDFRIAGAVDSAVLSVLGSDAAADEEVSARVARAVDGFDELDSAVSFADDFFCFLSGLASCFGRVLW